MYRNQAQRGYFYLMLAGVLACTTLWYGLGAEPKQAHAEGNNLVVLAKPTKTATPTKTPTATEIVVGVATMPTLPTVPATETATPTTVPTLPATETATTVPTVPATLTETPTGIPTMPTVPATETATPTAIATVPTVAPTATGVPTVPPVTPTPLAGVIFVSASKGGKVDGGKFSDEDILAYNSETDTWTIVFDGSDLGLNRLNLTDFYLMDDGSILMSFNKSFKLPGLGRVDDSDIIRFIPTQLGSDTEGTFEWFFDGSDVGLTSSSEDIDAIAFDPAGNLVISTKGAFHVGDLRGKDEDLFVLKNAQLGEETSGTWEIYFDGSAVELTKGNEDIDGAWIDPVNGNLYLSTKGDFKVNSLNNLEGDGNDVFTCSPTALGSATACTFQAFFDGDAARLTRRIDGIAISAPAGLIPLLPMSTTMDEDDGVAESQFTVLEDEDSDVDGAAIDEEVDEYDLEAEEGDDGALIQSIFLPIVKK